MLRADLFRASAEVKDWNKKYPPGTPVIVELMDGKTMKSTTSSKAFREVNQGRVWVEGFKRSVSLTALTPIKGE